MRNLLEFPITQTEMIWALDEAIALFPTTLIGDIRPVALRRVRELITETAVDRIARRMGGEFVPYAAQAMSAFGQDPKGLEAKPASAVPQECAKPEQPT